MDIIAHWIGPNEWMVHPSIMEWFPPDHFPLMDSGRLIFH